MEGRVHKYEDVHVLRPWNTIPPMFFTARLKQAGHAPDHCTARDV
jgi:hypothetical protein